MPHDRPTPRAVAYRGFRTSTQLRTGRCDGTAATGDGLVLTTPTGRREVTDPHTGRTGCYETGTWTSPPVRPGFAAREVVPSFTAHTPGGSWLQVDLSGTTVTGTGTRWYTMARWAADDGAFRRTTVPGQGDVDGHVDVDTFTAAAGRELTAWRVRVTLLRPAGSRDLPVLRSVGAVASAPPVPVTRAARGAGHGVVLDVPAYSQRVHTGHHPRFDGGGAAWCSPTSVAMLLAYWGTGPGPDRYAWVGPDDPRPVVDHAARHCYDHAYGGCGNWAFSTAYAGGHGLEAFVTRLRSLAEAELFVAAGVPLVLSVSYRRGQVPGLDGDTAGHLLVLAGFTTGGAPVLNDPNAADDAHVRRTVDRDRFEAAWLAASGGLVYVIHPTTTPLPPAPEQANW